MTKHLLVFLTAGYFASSGFVAAQHASMPPGMTHDEHLAQLKRDAELKTRGAAAMGFDQDGTEHHFLLFDDGGAIEVRALRGNDAATQGAVRSHLQTIARDFANGIFEKPFATHGETPAGVPDLKELKQSVNYSYEETAGGGRVRIRTADPQALAAIHTFLRYQIVEHKTGDPLTPRQQ